MRPPPAPLPASPCCCRLLITTSNSPLLSTRRQLFTELTWNRVVPSIVVVFYGVCECPVLEDGIMRRVHGAPHILPMD